MMMRDEATAKPIVEHDKPRYRVAFETSADSPEELQRRIHKGLGRELNRAKRKLGTRGARKLR